MDITALLEKMLIFVVLMVIGYFCARIGLAGREFTRDASKMVINIFLPATIIKSALGDISLTGGELATATLAVTVAVGAGYLIAAAASRLLPMKQEERPLFELLISVTNTMFFTMPVAASIFGDIAVLYCSLSCIPFNILLYTYGISRLRQSGGGGAKLKDILTMPLLATAVGLVLFLTHSSLPAVALELVNTMAAVTMPLSMIVIGASMGAVSLLDSFKNWRLYLMCAIRLLVCPLLVWLVVGLFTADIPLLATSVLIAGGPSAVIVTVLAIQYGRDPVYISEGILLSVVLSMLTTPLLVWLVA